MPAGVQDTEGRCSDFNIGRCLGFTIRLPRLDPSWLQPDTGRQQCPRESSPGA